jgi:hypothetical protein
MLVTTGLAHADVVATDCPFGGPTPGYDVIRLDLPTGSPFLILDIGEGRAQRGVNSQDNWHLTEGIFVVNAETRVLEAFRVGSQGMAPRRVVAGTDDEPLLDQSVVGPEVPYQHSNAGLRDGLPPGSYYVIAFGTDGGSALPNEFWTAGIQVAGVHACTTDGVGETFDFDQGDFTGGTQVYAPGAGYADAVSRSFETPREIVVGLMDAETQARSASDASLAYQMPTSSGTVSQQLVPFISTAGTHTFSASYRGVYPLIAVAGVTIDAS